MKGRVNKTETQIFHLLAHSAQWPQCPGLDQAPARDQELPLVSHVGVRGTLRVLDCLPRLSQVHQQGAQWAVL